MRLPVRLGMGEPSSGMGQAGVGDCCSCVELCEQRDVRITQPGFPATVILRFCQEGIKSPRSKPRIPKGEIKFRRNPCKSRTRGKLTSQVAAKPYRAFLSISRSSCRLLHPGGGPRPQGLVSRAEGWELGTQLIGGEVKQVLGLESDRSSLTGVGLILREGFVLLRVITGFSHISPQQQGPFQPPPTRGPSLWLLPSQSSNHRTFYCGALSPALANVLQ